MTGKFTTKPLAPTNFRIGSEPNEVLWTKSATATTNAYKLKYRSSEGGKAHEIYIEHFATQGNEISAVLKDLTENSVYKVNVFAIVYDSDEKEVESKELHEKVKLDIQQIHNHINCI